MAPACASCTRRWPPCWPSMPPTGSAWSASSSSAMCRLAMTVGQARGVALLAAAQAGLTVDEPTPNEVKQAVCGNGAADKEQVAGMVARLLGVSLCRRAG